MFSIGIDIGTTNIKGIIFDPTGQKVASAACLTRIHHNEVGWADLYPDEIYEDVMKILYRLVSLCPYPERIKALSFASFGESGVAVDGRGNPLAPAIAWFDVRAQSIVNDWRKNVDEYAVFHTTGMRINHIPSLAKILWEKKECPVVYQKAHKWLFITSYIILKLTGEFRTDHSLASRSMLFDIRDRRWSEEMCELADIPTALLPLAVPSGTPVGEIRKEIAENLGLKGRVILVLGGHDHPCGAFSVGIRHQGDILNSTGTVDILYTLVSPEEIDRRFFEAGVNCGCHVDANQIYMIGGSRSAGSLIEWLLKNLFLESAGSGKKVYSRMIDLAVRSPIGSNGVVILPHFRGSSLNNPLSRGAILGLKDTHETADIFRAAFEGLSFELRRVLEKYQELTGHPYPEIKCIGGGSRNSFWTQMKADILERKVTVNGLQENASLGAAILAGLGAGIFLSTEEAFRAITRKEETFSPDAERSQIYGQIYRQVYRDLARQMHAINLAIDEVSKRWPATSGLGDSR